MLYEFKCEVCGRRVDIERHYDAQTPPTVEEAGVCDVDERNGVTPHKWVKVIHAPRIAKGPGWGPGKGHY